MWDQMSKWGPNVFVNTIEDGLQKLRFIPKIWFIEALNIRLLFKILREADGKYAFIIEMHSKIVYSQKGDSCQFLRVGNNFNSRAYGIAVPHGSDLM